MRQALKHLSPLDLLQAEEHKAVLYTEGGSDLAILREWAQILDPESLAFLQAPMWHNNLGRHPREARRHLFALRAVRESCKGILLLDGDNRGLKDHDLATEGLTIVRWRRYEIENYLVVLSALERFVSMIVEDLFREAALQRGRDYLAAELPPAVLSDPLGDHDYLNATPASKTILPKYFEAVGVSMSRDDYYQIANLMRRDEINNEISEKLDHIAAIVDEAS